MYASRLWWLLRWLGHGAVAVLDGGFAQWTADKRRVSTGTEFRAASTFTPRPRDGFIVDTAGIAALAKNPGWRLVDARAPERYRGEVEPIDRVAGHIPGAVNHPYAENVDERGVFLPPDDLRSRLLAATGNAPPDRVVCYCGSGVTACQNLLAFEHAGLRGAKLYPGSWSEWSSDPARPVERGDASTPKTKRADPKVGP
jgi:thiosulfate/3-mercaptopyruvate sulfurtransferase